MTDPYPPWARWIAQDKYGDIWVYDSKPTQYFMFCEWGSVGLYDKRKFITKGIPNPHWRHSLDCLGEDDETI